jgi:hypothetical protein
MANSKWTREGERGASLRERLITAIDFRFDRDRRAAPGLIPLGQKGIRLVAEQFVSVHSRSSRLGSPPQTSPTKNRGENECFRLALALPTPGFCFREAPTLSLDEILR